MLKNTLPESQRNRRYQNQIMTRRICRTRRSAKSDDGGNGDRI